MSWCSFMPSRKQKECAAGCCHLVSVLFREDIPEFGFETTDKRYFWYNQSTVLKQAINQPLGATKKKRVIVTLPFCWGLLPTTGVRSNKTMKRLVLCTRDTSDDEASCFQRRAMMSSPCSFLVHFSNTKRSSPANANGRARSVCYRSTKQSA